MDGDEAVAGGEEVDSQHLAEIMRALANPVRIDLLKSLRTARTLGEIRLHAYRRDRGVRAGRIMNRVTTRAHLDSLLELGIARAIPRLRDGRVLDHYLLDRARLFALLEELRDLMLLRPAEEFADGTLPAPPPSPASARGPRFRLVNGVEPGRTFPLSAAAGRWVIGRRGDCAVCLDYDPYVSQENAEVTGSGRGYAVCDLGSRNGVFVNWERLAGGERRPLADGDAVGVGRSLLLFRAS